MLVKKNNVLLDNILNSIKMAPGQRVFKGRRKTYQMSSSLNDTQKYLFRGSLTNGERQEGGPAASNMSNYFKHVVSYYEDDMFIICSETLVRCITI
jgi:hypothetical protein